MSGTSTDAIERYLQTGGSDPSFPAWPGSFLARARQGTDDLRT